jgi:hypothetical protein
MTTAKNDITGDTIASKASTQAFRDNFDAIFRKTVKSGPAAVPAASEDGYTSVTTDTPDEAGDHAGHSTNP